MKGHGEKISRKQEQAIMALLTEPTIKRAAESVEIGETTLWRWMQLDDFKEAYRDAKRQAVSQTISRLQQASTEAVDTLREIMNDVTAPASSRVAAAKNILDTTVKVIEIEELETRIEELEQLQKMGGDSNYGIKK